MPAPIIALVFFIIVMALTIGIGSIRVPPGDVAALTGATRIVRHGGDYYVEAERRFLGVWSVWHPIEELRNDGLKIKHAGKTTRGSTHNSLEDAEELAQLVHDRVREHNKDGICGLATRQAD